MIPTRPFTHAALVGTLILASLLLMSGILLTWSYNSAITAVDKELSTSFQKRHIILESIVETRFQQVDLALHEILSQPGIFTAVSNRRDKKARALLTIGADAPAGFLLDIVFISTPGSPVWVDASSSLFDTATLLPGLAVKEIPPQGMIYRIRDLRTDFTVAVKSIPIVFPPTGRVLGRLFGAFILNNNQILLNDIRDKTRSGVTQFFVAGDVIGSSERAANPAYNTLNRIRPLIRPNEIHASKDLIAAWDFLRISGRHTPLEVMTAVSDTAYEDLKYAYREKILIASALSGTLCLFFVWLIRRFTTPSFRTLLQYCADVTMGDRKAGFKPGSITELNQVGKSMEATVRELKSANEEMTYLRNFLSNIIDSMPSVLIGINRDGRVTEWNQGAYKATGLEPERAIAHNLDMVFPRLAREMDRIRTAIETRQIMVSAKKPYREKNETRYEDITIFPLTGEGMEGAVVRVDDVTEQVRMEEMVIQSEKMLSVGGLAAGMAHEINNPLAGMIQNADVVRNRLLGDVPASRKAAQALGTDMDTIRAFMEDRKIPRMLDSIHSSGLLAADIVSNMLSFARKGDAGKIKEDLCRLMEETLALAGSDYDLKRKYDFKAIRIRKFFKKDMPKVPCESGKIQQVFLNILTNGAQAMADFRDRAPRDYSPEFTLTIRSDTQNHMAVVEIRDNGPGMDDAVRKRVFEPFFTTKGQGEGTGLGLSVSYFIIRENHNGHMSVVSAPDAGTAFIIKLPFEQPRELPKGQTVNPREPQENLQQNTKREKQNDQSRGV